MENITLMYSEVFLIRNFQVFKQMQKLKVYEFEDSLGVYQYYTNFTHIRLTSYIGTCT